MKKTVRKSSHSSLEINRVADLFQVEFELLKAKFLKSQANYGAGLEFQNNYSDLIDKTICYFSEYLITEANDTPRPAIIATGGYGREELSPYSDVDVLFIHEDPFNRDIGKFIEALNSQLWSLGIRLSASVRTLEDCEADMAKDPLFLTSLLEKRLVWGAKNSYQQLEKIFRRHIAASPPGFFISTKLAERDARHQKLGDSRYQLEPHVKEGKGGLRDIHTLLWIGNFLFGIRKPEDMIKKNLLTQAEAATLKRAQLFFWTVRCHLHLLAERADDRLSFDSQPLVAERMGYKDAEPNIRAEKFMKDYFLLAREVGHLTRVLCTKMEEQSLSGGATAGARKMVLQDSVEGFSVKNNRLTVESAETFRNFPSEIIRIFRVSQQTGIDIHPDVLRLMQPALAKLAKEQEASCRLFLEILLDPKRAETTLRRMNEADALAALIPEFRNIVAHMQYDMYHAYTADEHTLRAIGVLHALENGEAAEAAPLATSLFSQIHSRRALYAAMFLHDIAKGTGGNHSATGSKIARDICPRLGLTPEETETAAWLVEEHLAMTMTAFKRDISDDKTIQDFVALVQSPERLKLLTLLTTADIMAVGPERWNNWKGGLLAELYHRTHSVLTDIPSENPAAKETRPDKGWKDGETHIKITPQPEQDHTEVVIFTPDRKGLFATLAGAMAAAGASIVGARIFTRNNGMALDVFHIQSVKGAVYENSTFLTKTIKAALEGKIDLAEEIHSRQKNASRKDAPFKIPPRVIIDNDASNSNTVIEINGKDRPGLLYDVTSALSREGLQISAAKIATFGSRAVDVFYVRDAFGLKILHAGKLKTIENGLKRALETRV